MLLVGWDRAIVTYVSIFTCACVCEHLYTHMEKKFLATLLIKIANHPLIVKELRFSVSYLNTHMWKMYLSRRL